MKSIRVCIRAVQSAGILAASAALCVLGLPLHAQLYTSYVFQGTNDGSNANFSGSNFVGVIDEPMPLSTLTPNYHFFNNQEQYTNPDNNITTTFTASAAAASKGIWAAGMSASGSVTNGYNPGSSHIGTKDPPFGYYVQSAFGSATGVTFYSSTSSIVNAQSNMHWAVSGNKSSTLGRVDPRLDFAVTTNTVSSVFDIFNSSIAPNPLRVFGFGNYNYNVPIQLGQTQNFLFWASDFWEVDPADLPANPTDFSGQIDSSHSFDLTSIDLTDSNGDPIPDWTLVDNASGNVIWTQDGRVTPLEATPEPGSITLLSVLGVTGIALTRRRKSRPAKS